MLLSSLLLTPILGVFSIFIGRENSASLRNIKLIALITSILSFFISLIIFILFDFSTNQFQFVKEYHEISHYDFYLGVDGLSIYFILLTTIIIPISLVSNWKSITKDVESYVITKLVYYGTLLLNKMGDYFLKNMNLLSSILFSVIFFSILYKLEWNIPQTIEVLFLYLVLIRFLVLSYQISEIHNYGDYFGLYIGYCISRLEGCIANSICNDLFLATLFIIGISMVILSLLCSNKNKSIKEKLIFFVENFYFILPFMICMFIFIFIMKIFLLLCGIGVSISTVNLTLFCYTL